MSLCHIIVFRYLFQAASSAIHDDTHLYSMIKETLFLLLYVGKKNVI